MKNVEHEKEAEGYCVGRFLGTLYRGAYTAIDTMARIASPNMAELYDDMMKDLERAKAGREDEDSVETNNATTPEAASEKSEDKPKFSMRKTF